MKLNPSKKNYVIAAVLVLIGLVGCVYTVYTNFRVRENVQWVVAPGSAEINIAKAGKYMIYNEYNSNVEVEGQKVVGTRYLLGLQCTLSHIDTGEQIELISAPGGSYNMGEEISAVSLYEFTIDKPGIYQLTASFAESVSGKIRTVLVVDTHIDDMIFGPFIQSSLFILVFCGSGYLLGFLTYKKRKKAITQ